MVYENLIQDLGLSELPKNLRWDMVMLHNKADDYGYLTLKDALTVTEYTNEAELKPLLDAETPFISIKNGIVRCEDWHLYQKLRIDRKKMSNLKHRYHGHKRAQTEAEYEQEQREYEEQKEKRRLRQKVKQAQNSDATYE